MCRKANSVSAATDERRSRRTNSFRSSEWRAASISWRSRAHPSQCAAPEHLADDRGVLQELLLIAGEPVQPSGDNPLHALRHVVEHAALREEPGELLGVERIPLGSVEHGRPDANGDHGTFDEARDETARFLLGQRRKTDRQRIRLATAPARPP